MTITPAEFHSTHMGWGLDIDGAAGVQCVDLAKEHFRIVGVPNYATPIGGDGYADNIWYNRSRWSGWYDFISPGNYKNGDMVIFPHASRGGWTHPYSHVCFYYDGKSFGTNQGGNRTACDISTNWADSLGALRWKEWNKPMEDKTIEQLAYEVIAGIWGNGEERKRLLINAGYDYEAIQAKVNEILANNQIEDPEPILGEPVQEPAEDDKPTYTGEPGKWEINWRQKLSSRKFWAALAALIVSLIAFFGADQETITRVTSLVTAVGSLVVYMLAESWVDASREGAKND